MSNIIILGAGSMGVAFSFPCSDNKHKVTIVGTYLENDFIEKINFNRKHYSLDTEVPKSVVFKKFETLNQEINKEIDLIVIAVASKGIDWASIELSKVLKKNIPILILTKGLSINNNGYEVLAHKMERIFKEKAFNRFLYIRRRRDCFSKPGGKMPG